jgi:hypothetical protein
MDSLKKAALVLIAVLGLIGAPAAGGAVDYSKNSATGDYAPALTPAPEATTAAASDEGFAWDAAAVGAGAALAVALVTGRGRRAAASGWSRRSSSRAG